MLKLTIKKPDQWDNEAQMFIIDPGMVLEFEHSLVSLSKWEATFEKPFMGSSKTTEEALGYAQAMCLTPDVPPEVFQSLSNENIEAINVYVDAKMTATWFNEPPNTKGARKETVTAEIIYYWMVTLTIPFECETWHLNRLLTLIKVCNQKNAPPKKMNKADELAERQRLNAQRKAKGKTSG
jgi:hypothetical protein